MFFMLNQSELSSYVTTIVTVLLAYTSGSTVGQSELVGLVVAVISLGMVLWNEAHNSDFVSGRLNGESSSDDVDGVDYGASDDLEVPIDEE